MIIIMPGLKVIYMLLRALFFIILSNVNLYFIINPFIWLFFNFNWNFTKHYLLYVRDMIYSSNYIDN